jgi:hypothetical protein
LQPRDDPISGAQRGHCDVGAGFPVVVFWRVAVGDASLQPRDGALEDQFPVIRMNGQFFSMSLRMMKAVWWGMFWTCDYCCYYFFAEAFLQAQRPAEEGVREHGASAVWGTQAANPYAAVR